MGLDQLLEKDTHLKYKITYESEDDNQTKKDEEPPLFKFIKIEDSKSEPVSCKLRVDASHNIIEEKPKPFLKDSNL